jgi:hypothetical protein
LPEPDAVEAGAKADFLLDAWRPCRVKMGLDAGRTRQWTPGHRSLLKIGSTKMSPRAALFALMTALALTVAADSLPVGRTTGGGARSAGTSFRLNGAIAGFGQPTGSPRATGANRSIDGGFYPAALHLRPPENAADPAWLAVGEGFDTGRRRELQRGLDQ